MLLVHRIDNDFWALPGGAVDLGESVIDAALREIAEETGVTIELTGLVGIYSDPGHVMAYDDGEVRQQFSILFNARLISGLARQDDTEIKAVQWVDPSDMPSVKIHPSMRRRIDDAIAERPEPQIV
jgi:ADP-ribose pyrophosphatase YjhB (NUDIX family)